MQSHLRIVLILILAALATGGLGPAVAEARKKSDEVVAKGEPSQKQKANADHNAVGPMDVFADIERGWNAGNVDPILRHFGSQKVAISVQGTSPSGGTFSRNQGYYLLKDLFRYTVTRKFEFVQYRKPTDDDSETFAVAERHYQKSDDGRLFKDKVYVSLHLERNGEDERWVVDEIKSIR
jgi:hypothetical protein